MDVAVQEDPEYVRFVKKKSILKVSPRVLNMVMN